MCGIAIVWNLNVVVKFLVNNLWNAQLYLLAFDEEYLSVVVGCGSQFGL